MRNIIKTAAIVIPSLTALALTSSAGVLLQDNFDSYANQAAFQANWTAAVGTGGVLSSANSSSFPNSISYGTASARNDRSFTESGNPSALNEITFSFDFYDTDSTVAPYRQYAVLADGAPSGSGQLISMGLNNNLTSAADGGNYYMARILGYTPPGSTTGAYFKLNDGGTDTLRSTGWHNLAVKITDTEFNFYVDGTLSKTVDNTYTLRSYDNVRIGSGVSSTTAAAFDNVLVSVAPVPEPSTIALGLLGGASLLFMGRRRASK